MSTGYAILISLGVCVMAATLEGVCAGKNVKSYFAKLQFPPYSAPLWVWYIIGGFYYAIFFFVIYRLLRHDRSTLKHAALMLIMFMMVINAFWNYIFFRAQNLFLGFIGASLFPILDITLFICLIQLDKLAAWALIPYLLYRIYSLWWGYGLWKMNGRAA